MTIRWITEQLGTSPWREELAPGPIAVVDVRLLRDAAGNSPVLIREKIAEARGLLERGERVVICCDFGISRSNAIAAAVLAEDAGISLDESLLQVIQATGETGIKIDFVEDLRSTLCITRPRLPRSRAFVLGLDGFVGRAIGNLIDPALSVVSAERDQALIENPVLLDSAMDAAAGDRILFCWHPPGLDTNRAAGQLITALRNVLEVCRVRGAGLIFVSGHQVFDGHKGKGQVSFCEADVPQPAGAAGDGLFLGETLIKQYGERHKLPMLIVRPTHLYGPGDERPSVLNTMIRKALAQQEVTTHRYQNGAPLIDLLHVRDLARALQFVVEKQLTGVLHVASGNHISTRDLAGLIVRKANSSSKVVGVEMPGDYSMVRLDSTIVTAIPEWKPTIDLETGLSELIASARQSPIKEKT